MKEVIILIGSIAVIFLFAGILHQVWQDWHSRHKQYDDSWIPGTDEEFAKMIKDKLKEWDK